MARGTLTELRLPTRPHNHAISNMLRPVCQNKRPRFTTGSTALDRRRAGALSHSSNEAGMCKMLPVQCCRREILDFGHLLVTFLFQAGSSFTRSFATSLLLNTLLFVLGLLLSWNAFLVYHIAHLKLNPQSPAGSEHIRLLFLADL